MLASPFEVPVAGVTFSEGYPNSIFKISTLMIEKDTPLLAKLVREPDNEYDEFAIKVVVGGNHVGYIPSSLNKQLAYEIDYGERWAAVVARIVMSPENQDQPGLRLKVIKNA
tara:strand:- start:257 stop:592 length:336 start_codon:yes stop_codon:yes gene_type:complete